MRKFQVIQHRILANGSAVVDGGLGDAELTNISMSPSSLQVTLVTGQQFISGAPTSVTPSEILLVCKNPQLLHFTTNAFQNVIETVIILERQRLNELFEQEYFPLREAVHEFEGLNFNYIVAILPIVGCSLLTTADEFEFQRWYSDAAVSG